MTFDGVEEEGSAWRRSIGVVMCTGDGTSSGERVKVVGAGVGAERTNVLTYTRQHVACVVIRIARGGRVSEG